LVGQFQVAIDRRHGNDPPAAFENRQRIRKQPFAAHALIADDPPRATAARDQSRSQRVAHQHDGIQLLTAQIASHAGVAGDCTPAAVFPANEAVEPGRPPEDGGSIRADQADQLGIGKVLTYGPQRWRGHGQIADPVGEHDA
jgi:hypothetical protein